MDTMDQLKIYQKIIASVHDGIVISDAAGRIVAYNPAQEQLEDHDASDMVGKYLWEAYQYGSSDHSEHQTVLESGKPILDKYKAHAYKNGTPKYVSYSTYPVLENGRRIGVFSVSKNETKLHALLEETIELKRQFFQTLPKAQEIDKETPHGNGTRFTFSDIVGDSQVTKQLIHEAQTLAWMAHNILIAGETGTGKEVYAQSIHNYGKKNKAPFLAINCAAIPENLLEGILFGTVKGAFTGAVDRSGIFEEAGEGTIFLDELNSMPVAMQAKLLRVIQERRFNRVGGTAMIPVKCRIMCAVNEDPYDLIESGRLRKDLYYRIASLSLYIPPLRHRRSEILGLADHFIQKSSGAMNRKVKGLSPELKDLLLSYRWPGNVRELEHVIENLVLRAMEGQTMLKLENLPPHLSMLLGKVPRYTLDHDPSLSADARSLNEKLRAVEVQCIFEALEASGWNLSAAARRLGIIRQSLASRMKKLNITRPGD